jgi:subtilisin family serine protease
VNTWPTLDDARSFLRNGTGRGVKIAVLDSGIEATHPMLEGLTLADDLAVIDDGLRLATVEGQGKDVFGHGTAIAGIIRRVAPDAEIGSFRVLGEQLRSRTLIIREGVRLALERGYQILNCSFGCGREDHVLHYKDWIDEAYLRGRHIVAACNNQDFMKREWPGHFPTVITVNFSTRALLRASSTEIHAVGGASVPANRDAAAADLFYRPGNLVEFIAPGQDIVVAWLAGAIKKVTGSSFAAPYVAGLLARLISGCPSLSPLHTKTLLQKLASPLPS